MIFAELEMYKPEQVVYVKGNPVWDYKFIEEENTLHLISEPVEDIEEYGAVSFAELANYVGLVTDCILVDETDYSMLTKEDFS